MKSQKQIPVYLFTGFLDSGKTRFIQGSLEDPRFMLGEKTLMLVCEEGEEEYAPERFTADNIVCKVIESEEDFNLDYLNALQDETNCDSVIIEYNGMWLLDTLYANMPDPWLIYQEFMFVDTTTFLVYNNNMRNLVGDKLQSCDSVIFNRYSDSVDKAELHKIVRALNRNCDIIYETPDGKAELDEIQDPPPYDMSASVIEITPENYAYWYRDLQENQEAYKGRTVHVSGFVVRAKELGKTAFVFGRQLMICCAADTTFAGMICEWSGTAGLKNRDWVTVTAVISFKKHKSYDSVGPVLTARSVTVKPNAIEDVATFY